MTGQVAVAAANDDQAPFDLLVTAAGGEEFQTFLADTQADVKAALDEQGR
jgi:hypothetical protein